MINFLQLDQSETLSWCLTIALTALTLILTFPPHCAHHCLTVLTGALTITLTTLTGAFPITLTGAFSITLTVLNGAFPITLTVLTGAFPITLTTLTGAYHICEAAQQ